MRSESRLGPSRGVSTMPVRLRAGSSSKSSASAGVRQRVRPVTVSMDALEHRFADRLHAAPDAGFGAAVTDADVLAALDELPEEFRATVLLVDVDELTYEEAAAALGCAVGTVRSRLHRARRVLAVALEDYARDRRLVPARTEER